MFEISKLKEQKLSELQEIAEKLNISKYKTLKKLDLVYKILDHQASNPENEEKNSYVTEELILYVFLGIFIIYVLDSFVRVGKYTR